MNKREAKRAAFAHAATCLSEMMDGDWHHHDPQVADAMNDVIEELTYRGWKEPKSQTVIVLPDARDQGVRV